MFFQLFDKIQKLKWEGKWELFDLPLSFTTVVRQHTDCWLTAVLLVWNMTWSTWCNGGVTGDDHAPPPPVFSQRVSLTIFNLITHAVCFPCVMMMLTMQNTAEDVNHFKNKVIASNLSWWKPRPLVAQKFYLETLSLCSVRHCHMRPRWPAGNPSVRIRSSYMHAYMITATNTVQYAHAHVARCGTSPPDLPLNVFECSTCNTVLPLPLVVHSWQVGGVHESVYVSLKMQIVSLFKSILKLVVRALRRNTYPGVHLKWPPNCKKIFYTIFYRFFYSFCYYTVCTTWITNVSDSFVLFPVLGGTWHKQVTQSPGRTSDTRSQDKSAYFWVVQYACMCASLFVCCCSSLYL